MLQQFLTVHIFLLTDYFLNLVELNKIRESIDD